MSERSTTPEVAEVVRPVFEAVNRGDLDAAMSFYAPDAVWDAMEMGTSFEGVGAIRGLYEDWIGAYQQYEIVPEEIVDLGNGVVLAVNRQKGRPAGSTRDVELRQGTVSVWEKGVIVRVRNFRDIGDARTDGQRLAEERA